MSGGILLVIFFFIIICIRENYHCAPRAFWDFGNWNIPRAPFDEPRGYRPPKHTNVDEYDIFGPFPPLILTESSSETITPPSSMQTKTTGVSTKSSSTETLPVTTTIESFPSTIITSKSQTTTETKPTTSGPTTTTTARKFDIREFIKLSFHNNCSSSTCTINIKRFRK